MAKARAITIQDLLDEQVAALDSAMLVAQSAAEQGPIHKLRTSTRRVEAQLALLDVLPGLPPHEAEMRVIRRLLKKVRRAAATVRDMDVQAEMIASDAPEKVSVRPGSTGDKVRKEAKSLLKFISKRRSEESVTLVETLRKTSEQLAASMRDLQQLLKPIESPNGRRSAAITFRPTELSECIQGIFANRADRALNIRKLDKAYAMQRLQHLDEDALHDLRKAAKQCRYMAESLPENSSVARAIAQRFEYMQVAGGHWHDWLILEELAQKRLGRGSALAQRYRNHAQAALAEYHLQLALEFTTGMHALRRAA